MRLGGVILASVGIIIVVLVANGRWSSVWAAMLGPGAATSTTTGSTSEAPTVSPIPPVPWTDAPSIL